MTKFTHRLGDSWRNEPPHCVSCFRVAWFGAMSSGDAPKSAGVGCAGNDGMASAGKKKRAPDMWKMLCVTKPMQNAAGGHHQQLPCSFLSKEVAEPQPALDPGEESDTGSCFSDDPSAPKERLRDEFFAIATRLANEQEVCHRRLAKCCLDTNLYPSTPPHRRR